jgi:hypothetical protein
VIHKVAAQVAPADDDYVILHFAGEHAASLLRVVTLHRLQNKNGNDNSEQNALAPEGVENPQRTRLDAKIDRVQEGFRQGQMFEVMEKDGAHGEPHRQQCEAPAALAEEESDSNPNEAAHENLLAEC